MEYLQYLAKCTAGVVIVGAAVLNLIINGIPSILAIGFASMLAYLISFKPYYKWNTFNTITPLTGTVLNAFLKF